MKSEMRQGSDFVNLWHHGVFGSLLRPSLFPLWPIPSEYTARQSRTNDCVLSLWPPKLPDLNLIDQYGRVGFVPETVTVTDTATSGSNIVRRMGTQGVPRLIPG